VAEGGEEDVLAEPVEVGHVEDEGPAAAVGGLVAGDVQRARAVGVDGTDVVGQPGREALGAGARVGATFRFVFGVLFLLVLLPTLFMGGTYPVATRALSRGPGDAPEQVGRACAWSTVGAIVGSLGAGLVLLELGRRDSLWLAVELNLVAAAVLLGTRRGWLLPIVGLLAWVALPAWNPRHMNLAPTSTPRIWQGIRSASRRSATPAPCCSTARAWARPSRCCSGPAARACCASTGRPTRRRRPTSWPRG